MQRFPDTFQQGSGPYASMQQAKHADWRTSRTVFIAATLMLAALITMVSLARPAHAAEEPLDSNVALETPEVNTSPSTDIDAMPVTDVVLAQDDSTPDDPGPVDIVVDEQPAPEPEPEHPLTQSEETVPLYRIYNAQTSEHFYTTDRAERDSICSIGWVYEGVGWMVPLFSDLPVFRLYNPMRATIITRSPSSSATILSNTNGALRASATIRPLTKRFPSIASTTPTHGQVRITSPSGPTKTRCSRAPAGIPKA